ncbi:uncharacterized protein LOC111615339, partial [Centruroides sculpturatus]|uniref:uncharacterized protein LOC111615339 n=1 Tax=Centruroides sculpturatus TaxID=218467 RepID=UPI000C6E7277
MSFVSYKALTMKKALVIILVFVLLNSLYLEANSAMIRPYELHKLRKREINERVGDYIPREDLIQGRSRITGREVFLPGISGRRHNSEDEVDENLYED